MSPFSRKSSPSVIDNLRLAQNPNLTRASITSHIQPSTLIKAQTRRPEASRRVARPITSALGHIRVGHDIDRTSRARERRNRRDIPIRTLRERNLHELEPRRRAAVPRSVVRNIRISIIGVELDIDGRRVREQGELRGRSFRVAGVVGEGRVWRLDEPVSDLEGLVLEDGGVPDGEAGWVAVPVVVWGGDVAHEVQFLARVVLVHVGGLAVDGALEVVAAVLDTPEPGGC